MEKKTTPETAALEPEPASVGKQSDLAEGEVETVEESIRAHEKKGDVQGRPSPEKKGDKA